MVNDGFVAFLYIAKKQILCINRLTIITIIVYLFDQVIMEYKYINPEYLESVAGGDPGIIRDLVEMFREQSSETYTQMLELLNLGDYNNLGMLAHKVKSSVAIMGMNDLAVMLKNFELQAREGREIEMYKSYIERFRADTFGALAELDNLVNNRHK